MGRPLQEGGPPAIAREALLSFGPAECQDLDAASTREWRETNGLGGYASGTVSGIATRRYHGLLVASLQPPARRFVLLSRLEDVLVAEQRWELSANRYPGVIHPRGFELLRGFRLDPWPVHTYACEGRLAERVVCMLHRENTTVIRWTVRPGTGPVLEVRPLIAFRDHHALTRENSALDPRVEHGPGWVRVQPYSALPPLYLCHTAADVAAAGYWHRTLEYWEERERGLDWQEDLFCPCILRLRLDDAHSAALIASLAPRDAAEAGALLEEEAARREALVTPAGRRWWTLGMLERAADQFVAVRQEGATVLAGYPWFLDWGRDTMISLPGLTLARGRPDLAASILLQFADHVDQGMLPNRFPESGEEPEYNTVDATLWFLQAVDATLRSTRDRRALLGRLYPVLREILHWHARGTRHGIRADADGLLVSGEEGVQLTWMDARVGSWVVTPRMGKPVEVQALWHSGLRILGNLAREAGDREAERLASCLAAKARRNFLPLFWNAAAGCLYDVVAPDGPDPSIRPNQVIALSLPHPLVPRKQALSVLAVVRRELLTPFGLRTLSPADPRYRPACAGGVESRDSAYHMGTVWPWLLGPFFSAWLRVHRHSASARRQVRRWLAPLETHLREAGLGQVSEIFDAEPPHRPRGCPAQAWSVAELLRVLAVELEGDCQGAGPRARPAPAVELEGPAPLSAITPGARG